MDRIRIPARICRGNLKRISANPRLYLAVGWVAMTIFRYMLELRRISAVYEEPVSAWMFPLLLEKSGNQMFVILGATLLFCDAPFLYDNSSWQIIRSGRRNWFWGNILYIGALSLIYTVAVFLLPVLFVFPRVSFSNEWGALLGSMAQTSLPDQLGLSRLSYTIMVRYAPLEAVCLSGLAVWLNAVLAGVLCYAVNLLVKRGLGPAACIAMGLMPTFMDGFSSAVRYVSYYLAPPSWMNLENYNLDGYGAGPPPFYIYLFFTAAITVCVVVSRLGIVRKDLDTIQEL